MIAATTIPELFLTQASQSADRLAIQSFCEGGLLARNWFDLSNDVLQLTDQIANKRFSRGSRIAHLSENRYEWIVADLAIQFCGLVHVPLHPHLSLEQIRFQYKHSDAELLLISPSFEQSIPGRWADPTDFLVVDSCRSKPTTSSCAIEGLRKRLVDSNVQSNDLISIIYTSGTTGEPNGVMLSHDNVIQNIKGKLDALPLYPDDIRLAFLPMTHIFSRTCDLYTWLAAGCQLVVSKGRQFLFEECEQFRPTYINGVPFFYQRCYELIQRSGQLAQKNVLRELLGGNIRLCNCGGAPLADHVFDFFHEQGVMLVTGYGLTETAPVLTSNRERDVKKGTVGPPLCNVDIKIAADGELLVKGPNVTQGYWKAPEKTADAFAEDWFCTGDLVNVDDDGFVSIIGRKKEMILTSGGFNVFPGPLEELLVQSPLIDQCMIIGNQRDYLIALVTPANPSAHSSIEQLSALFLNEANILLKSRSRYEQVRQVLFTDEPFTIENGLLTPKLSMRRALIAERYAALIDRAYQSNCRKSREIDSAAESPDLTDFEN